MFNPVPFLTYIIIMAYTPGPNNIMSMSNASENGLKKSFPFNLGVFLGIFSVMTMCLVFGRTLYFLIPQIRLYMMFLGAAYMIWLAWGLVFPSKSKASGQKASTQGFWTGTVLQFINPKLYIYGITSTSSYILPYFSKPLTLWGFAFLLAFVGFTATICWALFGAALNRFFKERSRAVNIVMALLLCYCAVSLFL